MASVEPERGGAVELSVVVPVFNEEAGIGDLVARLVPVLQGLTPAFEILFVDDGSRDNTLAAIRRAAEAEPRIGAISFSRNFGKEIAIAAGLDEARGQAVVIMDADLQHPPEVIREFVEKWREGAAMVYAVRRDRETDSVIRRMASHWFYRLYDRFAETDLPEGAGDFRLIDRKAVEALKSLPERARFSKGLYAWIGFPAVGVPFDVAERAHGKTKWNYGKLTRFAFDGITSFSTVPLRISTLVGVLISAVALAYAAVFLLRTLIFGADVPGFPSLIVSIMFFSGIQLVFLGIIGEYVGRIFNEVKRRPLYFIDARIGAAERAPSPAAPPGRRPG